MINIASELRSRMLNKFNQYTYRQLKKGEVIMVGDEISLDGDDRFSPIGDLAPAVGRLHQDIKTIRRRLNKHGEDDITIKYLNVGDIFCRGDMFNRRSSNHFVRASSLTGRRVTSDHLNARREIIEQQWRNYKLTI